MCALLRLVQVVGDPLLWVCILWAAWLLSRVWLDGVDRGRRWRQLWWVGGCGFGIIVLMNLASATELSYCLPTASD